MNANITSEDIKARIQKALDIDGTHTWDDLVYELEQGHSQIFWNEHGAWITKIVVYPRKKILNVWIVAGEMPGVMALQDQVDAHARANGCSQITAVARFGWEKFLDDYGWTKHATMIARQVEA